jgi:hypothetical protein
MFHDRALRSLRKLARHDIRDWVLTGGLAIELRLGVEPSTRPLNDIDFIVNAFDRIPGTLAEDLIFRHIHPFDAPGKTLLQSVDPDTAVRIDVFRAYGATIQRAAPMKLGFGTFQVTSLEDLVARSARLALDIAAGVPVPSKHARDFLRLAEWAASDDMETAWRDHRKPAHPSTFDEASRLLHELIPARPDLLITPAYSKETEAVCPRCVPTAALQFADANVVLGLLGYC